MRLKNDFYCITSSNETAGGMEYVIRLNPSHIIYQAHFPGNPITPGVCIIEIIKELSEDCLKCALFLQKVAKVKFLRVIDPVNNETIHVSMNIADADENGYKVTASVFNIECVFTQLSLMLERVS